MFINAQNAGRLSTMLRHHKIVPLVKINHFTAGLRLLKQVLQIMNVVNVD